jgi:hypothetical protein
VGIAWDRVYDRTWAPKDTQNGKESDMSEGIDFGKIFDIAEIRSPYLKSLLERVLLKIGERIDIYEDGFGAIYEERTFCGEDAEVTEEGDIRIDSDMLKRYGDDNVAMAVIAHELAHYYLNHHLGDEYSLVLEKEADDLAKKWGFEIDKMRKVGGPPTCRKTHL